MKKNLLKRFIKLIKKGRFTVNHGKGGVWENLCSLGLPSLNVIVKGQCGNKNKSIKWIEINTSIERINFEVMLSSLEDSNRIYLTNLFSKNYLRESRDKGWNIKLKKNSREFSGILKLLHKLSKKSKLFGVIPSKLYNEFIKISPKSLS